MTKHVVIRELVLDLFVFFFSLLLSYVVFDINLKITCEFKNYIYLASSISRVNVNLFASFLLNKDILYYRALM